MQLASRLGWGVHRVRGQIPEEVDHLIQFSPLGLLMSPAGLGQLRCHLPFLVENPLFAGVTLFAT